ncbi:MAG: DUF3488 and transglutaminase-like domain-containing protein [Myxococcales bacterium]|nr:DUF3488 and transglutaminase-like domain-containing protein [Myxococcales bacterium]
MRFHALHKGVTYLVSGLGLFALGLGGELDPVARIALWIGWVATWFVEPPLVSSHRWSRLMTWAVLAFLLVQVVRGLLGAPPLALGLEFAAVLQLSRLAHRRTAIDHQQIALLAFLHVVAASILSVALTYALVLLGMLIALPWMLVLTQLRREVERDLEGSVRPDADLRRLLESRRLIGGGLLVWIASLAVPLFAITSVLFLLFPRVGVGLVPIGQVHGRRVAGFGSHVELGGFGTIRDDPTVVLRVRVEGTDARRMVEAGLRLRGTSFDRYDGRRWTRSPDRAEAIGRRGTYYAIADRPVRPDLAVHIELEPLDEPVVFLPERTVGIEVPLRMRAGVPVGRRIARARGLDVRYLDADDRGLSYVAWVSTDPAFVTETELEAHERARYLALPDGLARTRALATSLTRGARTDAERVDRLLRHLRDSGRYRYTLELAGSPGRDPLDVFLFERRAGHCEYFSTALAVMARAVGVPSRNVTGFVGGWWNPYGGYHAIRQGDAHSWVEVYLDGRGWVTVDPTPPGRDALRPSESGWAVALAAMLDALESRWDRYVVGFDLGTQRTLLDRLRELFARARPASHRGSGGDETGRREDGSAGASSGPSSSAAGIAIALLAAGVAIVAAVAFGRRLASRLRAWSAGSQAAAVALFRDLERALRRHGLRRRPDETPRRFAERIAREGFRGAPTVLEVTDTYLEARYGGRSLSPERIRAARARLRAMR